MTASEGSERQSPRAGFPSSTPTVYGPVLSRRHGVSLGINLGIPDSKVCTWGCVYCQCGMGTRRSVRPDEWSRDLQKLLLEIESGIRSSPPLDSITFAGNTEPMAHPDFLAIVTAVAELRRRASAKWILNCLSNGSELARPEVLRACELLDEAWIKLDCATDEAFHALSRPIARIGSLGDHLKRISSLPRIFIQTMVWDCPTSPTLSNWTDENRHALLEAYRELRPEMIHLTTIARPPAVSRLRPVPLEAMKTFQACASSLGLKMQIFG